MNNTKGQFRAEGLNKQTRWTATGFSLASIQLLTRPNQGQSWAELLADLGAEFDKTGKALLWMVPNQMGVPYEYYSVPVATATLQPVFGSYPNGYYRIQSLYPIGAPKELKGSIVPAEWIVAFDSMHPDHVAATITKRLLPHFPDFELTAVTRLDPGPTEAYWVREDEGDQSSADNTQVTPDAVAEPKKVKFREFL